MKINQQYLIVISLVLLAIGLFTSMNVMELRAEEPRRALVTMEMLINGDFVHPSLNGEPYFHKPPFFNWLMAGFFGLVGSCKEWAVRLPSIIGYILTAIFLYFVVKKNIGKKEGILSALFFLFSADLLFYGTVNAGEMDLFLTLPVFFQIIILPILINEKKWLKMFLVSYFFMAIVFLTKHFMAFAFQFAAILALMLAEKKIKFIFSWQHILGVLFFLSLVSIYFYVYSIGQPLEPLMADLFFETMDKSGGKSFGDRLLYMLSYPFVILKIMFPWALLFVFLYKRKIREKLFGNSFLRFAFFFSIINFGLYWFLPETRDRYLYPLLPFYCIVLAVIFLELFKSKINSVLWVCIVMGVLRIGYNFIVQPIQQAERTERKIAFELLKIANGEKIYLTGWEVVRPVKESIFRYEIINAEVRYPAPIPYGIPYIITRETKDIVQFEPEPEKGKLYLAPGIFVKDKKTEILHTIPVDYIEGGLLLCRFK